MTGFSLIAKNEYELFHYWHCICSNMSTYHFMTACTVIKTLKMVILMRRILRASTNNRLLFARTSATVQKNEYKTNRTEFLGLPNVLYLPKNCFDGPNTYQAFLHRQSFLKNSNILQFSPFTNNEQYVCYSIYSYLLMLINENTAVHCYSSSC